MFNKSKKSRSSQNPDNNRKIFSYYQNREQAGYSRGNRDEQSKKKTPKFIANIPLYLSVLVIIASIIYTMSLTTTPEIKIVNSDSLITSENDIEKYKKLASELLSSSIFNRTKITINTDKIQNDLLEVIPEATDIAVALPIISRSPVVYVRIAEPVALLSTGSQKLVLDEKGRAITDSKDDNKSLVLVKDRSGLPINIGDQAVPTNQIVFINEVKSQLTQKKYEIEYFELSKNANELVVKIKKKDFVLKYNLSGDVRLQSGTAISTIKYLGKNNIIPKKYIDVRVEERAYYK
ncbi:MAG TPA: hypothetical protein PKB09_02765 [Candidatus Saccharibacteria bacterium]|nr:hypothetical protein [Candidatus Saccharibacteria bacterium]